MGLKLPVYMFVLMSLYWTSVDSGTGSLNVPACIVTTNRAYQDTMCNNPLYTACGYGVCCGPHHYCCDSFNNTYWKGVSCCRRSAIYARRGEIASVVLGSLSWSLIVCVIGFITCPRLYGEIQGRFQKRIKTTEITMKKFPR
ncbi:hypothetical protein ACJMK2_019154 [Sinanodonta woodiana]|uniref:Cysteine rich secreted protein n=1 Tax=Sinanodonta woodiana TaxID=1069815 RepID=A0ABD3UJJ8_SINWO